MTKRDRVPESASTETPKARKIVRDKTPERGAPVVDAGDTALPTLANDLAEDAAVGLMAGSGIETFRAGAALNAGTSAAVAAPYAALGAGMLAAGGVHSALTQGAELLDTMRATGASWRDVGAALKDVFTTRQGWKDLGRGLLGSTADAVIPIVGPKVGDRIRDGMGDKASKWTWGTYRWNPENGRRIDPKNIKGTGIAFDEKDRAVLPADRRQAFEAWMDELADPKGEWTTDDGRKVKVSSQLVPKDWRTNREYNRDYDYVRAFLLAEQNPDLKRSMLGPVFHPEDGKYWLHMNDVGKLPTHPVFSTDSYYAQDPKYAPLAGGWEGETYIPGKAESEVHEDAKGGDTGPAEGESIPEPGGASASSPAGGGPRIVINPSTFKNEKDALCVAFNEAFRLVMEEMEFDPVSEPTDAQRKFFSDTAYADDELQLRRTILARICTFDTSVKDPTDEQLQESVEFLGNVLESGAPQNEWEQKAVMRLRDVLSRVSSQGKHEAPEEAPPEEVQGDIYGGLSVWPKKRKTGVDPFGPQPITVQRSPYAKPVTVQRSPYAKPVTVQRSPYAKPAGPWQSATAGQQAASPVTGSTYEHNMTSSGFVRDAQGHWTKPVQRKAPTGPLKTPEGPLSDGRDFYAEMDAAYGPAKSGEALLAPDGWGSPNRVSTTTAQQPNQDFRMEPRGVTPDMYNTPEGDARRREILGNILAAGTIPVASGAPYAMTGPAQRQDEDERRNREPTGT